MQVTSFWVLCGAVSIYALFRSDHWGLAIVAIAATLIAFGSGWRINCIVAESKDILLNQPKRQGEESKRAFSEFANDDAFWIEFVPPGWLVLNFVSGIICILMVGLGVLFLFW